MFTCAACLRNFTILTNLIRHIIDVHEIRHRFRCGLCNVSCSRKSDVVRHHKRRHPQITRALVLKDDRMPDRIAITTRPVLTTVPPTNQLDEATTLPDLVETMARSTNDMDQEQQPEIVTMSLEDWESYLFN